VLEELEGPPIDYDKSKTLVMLRLANRFSNDKRMSPRNKLPAELTVT
jgi:hypothetical protein